MNCIHLVLVIEMDSGRQRGVFAMVAWESSTKNIELN